MNKLSIIVSALIFSTSVYASNSIDEAFKNGKVSGDISTYYNSAEEGNTDSGFSVGTAGINYSTDSLNGFTLNTGFRAAHVFSEEVDGDADGDITQNSILHTANISYENDLISLTIGRQEIDLEWLGDYNEAVVLSTSAITDTVLTAGYTTRQAAAGADEIGKFEDITNDGAFVIDAKYEGIKNLTINPYFYSANDVLDFYGLKIDYDTDLFGATAHYAKSSEEDSTKDTNITHLEARTSLSDLNFALGYIKTGDKEVGNMAAFGDNIDPTEELDPYTEDTKTIYLSAGYEIAGAELSALYAQAKRTNSDKDKELTLGVSYGFTDTLSGELIYTDVSKDSADDLSKLTANLVYEF